MNMNIFKSISTYFKNEYDHFYDVEDENGNTVSDDEYNDDFEYIKSESEFHNLKILVGDEEIPFFSGDPSNTSMDINNMEYVVDYLYTHAEVYLKFWMRKKCISSKFIKFFKEKIFLEDISRNKTFFKKEDSILYCPIIESLIRISRSLDNIDVLTNICDLLVNQTSGFDRAKISNLARNTILSNKKIRVVWD